MSRKGDDDYNDEKTNGRKMTRHHLTPRARGGKEGKNNIVKIPDRYHVAWHTFFGNLTPKEAIHFMRVIFSRKGKKHGKWTVEELYNLQLSIQEKCEKYK